MKSRPLIIWFIYSHSSFSSSSIGDSLVPRYAMRLRFKFSQCNGCLNSHALTLCEMIASCRCTTSFLLKIFLWFNSKHHLSLSSVFHYVFHFFPFHSENVIFFYTFFEFYCSLCFPFSTDFVNLQKYLELYLMYEGIFFFFANHRILKCRVIVYKTSAFTQIRKKSF